MDAADIPACKYPKNPILMKKSISIKKSDLNKVEFFKFKNHDFSNSDHGLFNLFL